MRAANETASQQQLLEEAERLYERYGQPLETELWGQYVAISRDGRLVTAPTPLEIIDKATEALGPDHFVFKIGERSVGKIR